LAWKRKSIIQPKISPSVKNQSKSDNMASYTICYEMMQLFHMIWNDLNTLYDPKTSFENESNYSTYKFCKCKKYVQKLYVIENVINGYNKDTLKLFYLMKYLGTKPNNITFVYVLLASSHIGIVDESCKYFNNMSDSYCIIPRMNHYACIIW